MRILFSVLCGGLLLLTASLAVAQSRIVGIADLTVGTTATLLRAANASRVSLMCTETGGTAMRIGGPDITTSRGLYLPAGGSITLTGSYAVYVLSQLGTTIISCSEELR